ETLKEMNHPSLCGSEILGAYTCQNHQIRVNPLQGPYDLGASLIHEIWHITTDVGSYGQKEFPSFLDREDLHEPYAPCPVGKGCSQEEWDQARLSALPTSVQGKNHILATSILIDETIASVTAISAQHFLHRFYSAQKFGAPPEGFFYQ